jgi:hypothetical protein
VVSTRVAEAYDKNYAIAIDVDSPLLKPGEVGIETLNEKKYRAQDGLWILKRKKFLKAIAKELGVCIHDDVNKVSYYADGTTERY